MLLRAALPPHSHLAHGHPGPDFGSCVASGPSLPFPTVAHRLKQGHHRSWVGGWWGGRQAGQLPEPGLARLRAQAALPKMAAVRVSMAQNGCAAEPPRSSPNQRD